MDCLPGLAAFERPTEERNTRGFGFQVSRIKRCHKMIFTGFSTTQEFMRINSLYTGGFLRQDKDTLVIKAEVKCGI